MHRPGRKLQRKNPSEEQPHYPITQCVQHWHCGCEVRAQLRSLLRPLTALCLLAVALGLSAALMAMALLGSSFWVSIVCTDASQQQAVVCSSNAHHLTSLAVPARACDPACTALQDWVTTRRLNHPLHSSTKPSHHGQQQACQGKAAFLQGPGPERSHHPVHRCRRRLHKCVLPST